MMVLPDLEQVFEIDTLASATALQSTGLEHNIMFSNLKKGFLVEWVDIDHVLHEFSIAVKSSLDELEVFTIATEVAKAEFVVTNDSFSLGADVQATIAVIEVVNVKPGG
jgi:hypothetical protein